MVSSECVWPNFLLSLRTTKRSMKRSGVTKVPFYHISTAIRPTTLRENCFRHQQIFLAGQFRLLVKALLRVGVATIIPNLP